MALVKFAYPDAKVNALVPGTQDPEVDLPGAPTDVSAVAGVESATVSFTAPVDTGGGVIEYRVSSIPATTPFVGPSSPLVMSNLETGVGYAFTVAARSADGWGPESALTDQVFPT